MTGFDHPESAPRTLGAVTVVLTAAAGAIDAVTFFEFNEVFASTMTGNLVLVGVNAASLDWIGMLQPTVAIAGYMAGLAVGTLVAGLLMRRLPWRNAVGATLTVELALLVVAGIGWFALSDPADRQWRAFLLIVAASTAMGMQAAALRYVGPSGTPTNFLTGTVTNWVGGMIEPHRRTFDVNSALRILALALGALAGAVIHRWDQDFSYVLPVVLVAVAIVLMARVTRADHGGLMRGDPQLDPGNRT